jgi:hypothetical protein
VAALKWNGWQLSAGFGGSIAPEICRFSKAKGNSSYMLYFSIQMNVGQLLSVSVCARLALIRLIKNHSIIFLNVAFILFVHAASFDFRKAESNVETQICGDEELSSLDEQLNTVYKKNH